MERDQLITALKSLLSAAEREFDTKRCRDSSLKALFAARKVLRSVAAAAPAVPSEQEIEAFIARVDNAINQMCDPTSPNFARNMVEVRAGMDVIRNRSVEFVLRAAAAAPAEELIKARRERDAAMSLLVEGSRLERTVTGVEVMAKNLSWRSRVNQFLGYERSSDASKKANPAVLSSYDEGKRVIRVVDGAIMCEDHIRPIEQSCENCRALSTADAGKKVESEPAAVVDAIVRAVAELPDRSSPEDWPEAMLVTAEELTGILRDALDPLVSKAVDAGSELVPLPKAVDSAIGDLMQAVRDDAHSRLSGCADHEGVDLAVETLRELLRCVLPGAVEPKTEPAAGAAVHPSDEHAAAVAEGRKQWDRGPAAVDAEFEAGVADDIECAMMNLEHARSDYDRTLNVKGLCDAQKKMRRVVAKGIAEAEARGAASRSDECLAHMSNSMEWRRQRDEARKRAETAEAAEVRVVGALVEAQRERDDAIADAAHLRRALLRLDGIIVRGEPTNGTEPEDISPDPAVGAEIEAAIVEFANASMQPIPCNDEDTRWNAARDRLRDLIARRVAEAEARGAATIETVIDGVIADRCVHERDCTLPLDDRVDNIIVELKNWRHEAATNEQRAVKAERERDSCCDDYQKEAQRAVEAEKERDEARAEIERLKAGGCARDQRTAQFCAEAVTLQDQMRTLLKWAEGWEQSDHHGPEWKSAFRCVAGQVRFLLGEGEALAAEKEDK